MFLENPHHRISLDGIAAHPWVTNEELPSNEEVKEECARLVDIRLGEINQWVKTDGESFVLIGNHGLIYRSFKEDYINVE